MVQTAAAQAAGQPEPQNQPTSVSTTPPATTAPPQVSLTEAQLKAIVQPLQQAVQQLQTDNQQAQEALAASKREQQQQVDYRQNIGAI